MEQTEININTKLALPVPVTDIKLFHTWPSMVLATDHDAEVCGERLGVLKEHRKKLDAEKDKVLGPLTKAVNEFRAMVRRVTDPMDAIDAALRGKLSAYMTAKREAVEKEAAKKRAEEIKKAEDEARANRKLAQETGSEVALQAAKKFEKNAEALANKVLDTSQTMRLSTTTIAEKTEWEIEIFDESKIPDEYWELDWKKLNAVKRAYGKTPVDIPGIRFKAVSNISVGG